MNGSKCNEISTLTKQSISDNVTNLSLNRVMPDINWADALQSLAYAQGKPTLFGDIKVAPKDFIVTELMDVTPSGEGEHYWLDI